jgi:hypothetical protein
MSSYPLCAEALNLIALRSSLFISDALQPRNEHLTTSWTPDDMYHFEVDHRELIRACKNDSGFMAIVDKHDDETAFNQAWDAIGGQRFRYPRRFCAGLATVFSNMAAVGSDFSILDWEKDEFRTALLDVCRRHLPVEASRAVGPHLGFLGPIQAKITIKTTPIYRPAFRLEMFPLLS